jgi:hypothetical protein
MVCRRGNIEGRDVGSIRVERTFSVVDVAANVAEQFESVATQPDPRDPRVKIDRWREMAPGADRRHMPPRHGGGAATKKKGHRKGPRPT